MPNLTCLNNKELKETRKKVGLTLALCQRAK
jgi:hypothetical protein